MANNFEGYLLKAVKTGKTFPNHYIQYESWKCTPNQREEIKAYRDDNTRDLTRITSKGTKTKIEFTTLPNLNIAETSEILSFFTDAEDIALERKIQVKYWNDENKNYSSGYFYRPDIEFNIKKIIDGGAGKSDIIYKELTIKLVEY